MVALKDVLASNLRIPHALPDGMVAVLVGATNGIGEYTLLAYAKYARRPRVYFVGRSQEAGDRIATECRRVNPEGTFEFIKADLSLLVNVDDVCRQIREKETAINILYLSIGTIVFGKRDTAEGLNLPMAIGYYARTRFIANLLPQIRAAKGGLRRVVSTLAGGVEGPVDTENLSAPGGGVLGWRNHIVSLTTLTMEEFARRAPDVSFVHDFPGVVRSAIHRDMPRWAATAFNVLMWFVGRWVLISNDESGERHVFLITSAMYPAAATARSPSDDGPSSSASNGYGSGAEDGVALAVIPGAAVAKGTDGRAGSGMYTINWDNENGKSKKVGELLASLRQKGVNEMVWKHTEEVFVRITGSVTMK